MQIQIEPIQMLAPQNPNRPICNILSGIKKKEENERKGKRKIAGGLILQTPFFPYSSDKTIFYATFFNIQT